MPDEFPQPPAPIEGTAWTIERVFAAKPDHVLPVSAGGLTTDDNLVTACGACNDQAKGGALLAQLGIAVPDVHAPVPDPWMGLSGRPRIGSVAAQLTRLRPPGVGADRGATDSPGPVLRHVDPRRRDDDTAGVELPSLVVLAGPPGAGKTTLARRIGDALGLPVVSRDAIKEGVAYTTGVTVQQGTAEAFRLFDLFYEVVDAYLERGISVVAEAAFRADIAPAELLERGASARLVLIRCVTDEAVWLRRFHDRGHRPGHRDWEFVARMESGDGPTTTTYMPDVAGIPTLDVNTTDGYLPAFDHVVPFIERHTR